MPTLGLQAEQMVKWNLYRYEQSLLSDKPSFLHLLKSYQVLVAWKRLANTHERGLSHLTLRYNGDPSVFHKVSGLLREVLRLLYSHLDFDAEQMTQTPKMPKVAYRRGLIGINVDSLKIKGVSKYG